MNFQALDKGFKFSAGATVNFFFLLHFCFFLYVALLNWVMFSILSNADDNA